MSLSRHPNHNRLRIICSSGQVNGRPVPLPPLERPITLIERSAAQRERYRQGAKKAWATRRAHATGT